MVKRYKEIEHVMIPQMKGGTGAVEKIASVDPGEYDSSIKVAARLLLRPGDSIGTHRHEDEEEIMTILSGSAEYADAEGKYRLGAGDVTVCRDGEEHSIRNASASEDLELFALVIGL